MVAAARRRLRNEMLLRPLAVRITAGACNEKGRTAKPAALRTVSLRTEQEKLWLKAQSWLLETLDL